MNILEQISDLCNVSDDLRIQQIKSIAKLNPHMLTEILYDYIRQNQDEPTYRKCTLVNR